MNYMPPPIFKNPGLAAVLSFFYMGLGQIYNGQIAKGVVFLVIYSISWILTIVVIGLITTPVLWIYGMYDAYRAAERINQDIVMRQRMNQQQPPPPGGPDAAGG